MPELPGREFVREWRTLAESLIAGAAAASGRPDLARLRQEFADRLGAPVDALFDLLEETGTTLRRQAETLQAAGRALDETAGLMLRQAELFESMVTAVRQPADLAKAVAGATRHGTRAAGPPSPRAPAPRRSPRAGAGRSSAAARGAAGKRAAPAKRAAGAKRSTAAPARGSRQGRPR